MLGRYISGEPERAGWLAFGLAVGYGSAGLIGNGCDVIGVASHSFASSSMAIFGQHNAAHQP